MYIYYLNQVYHIYSTSIEYWRRIEKKDAQRPCQDLPSSDKAIIYEFTNHFYLVTPVAMQFTHKTVNPCYHHLSWNSSGKSLFNEIISLIQPLLFKVVYVHRSSFSEVLFLFDIQKLFLQCIWCNYAALLLRKVNSSLTGGIALPFQNLFFFNIWLIMILSYFPIKNSACSIQSLLFQSNSLSLKPTPFKYKSSLWNILFIVCIFLMCKCTSTYRNWYFYTILINIRFKQVKSNQIKQSKQIKSSRNISTNCIFKEIR